MPIEDKRPILSRCVWCNPKHLMDIFGERLPGPADDKAFRYSDGLCKIADARANSELEQREKYARENDSHNDKH